METIIEIENLSKQYRKGFFMTRVSALEALSLEIYKGEIFGYLGPNGAGKSTTLKLLVNLIHPSSGKITIMGKDPSAKQVRAAIGFLPENPSFYDHLKVRQLLDFYGKLFGLGRSERKIRIARLLDLLNIEREADKTIRQLSKGNIQRVGLAQALINDPSLLILDEPMSGLDPIGRRELRDLILQLKQQGATILFSTHILPDVETICDRVGMIISGRMRKVGPLSDLIEPKTISYEASFSGVNKEALEAFGEEIDFVGHSENEVTVVIQKEKVEEIIESVKKANGRLVSLVPKKETLEEVFMREVEGRG